MKEIGNKNKMWILKLFLVERLCLFGGNVLNYIEQEILSDLKTKRIISNNKNNKSGSKD